MNLSIYVFQNFLYEVTIVAEAWYLVLSTELVFVA
jgi:hypothetical protein